MTYLFLLPIRLTVSLVGKTDTDVRTMAIHNFDDKINALEFYSFKSLIRFHIILLGACDVRFWINDYFENLRNILMTKRNFVPTQEIQLKILTRNNLIFYERGILNLKLCDSQTRVNLTMFADALFSVSSMMMILPWSLIFACHVSQRLEIVRWADVVSCYEDSLASQCWSTLVRNR